jgi:hypothetical protein
MQVIQRAILRLRLTCEGHRKILRLLNKQRYFLLKCLSTRGYFDCAFQLEPRYRPYKATRAYRIQNIPAILFGPHVRYHLFHGPPRLPKSGCRGFCLLSHSRRFGFVIFHRASGLLVQMHRQPRLFSSMEPVRPDVSNGGQLAGRMSKMKHTFCQPRRCRTYCASHK